MPIDNIQVRGLIEAQAKLDQVVRDLRGEAMLSAMRESTLLVTRSAKKYAPVDTGRLRASITPEVRRSGVQILGVVGSNVQYAAAVELGSKPHFPPVAALETWARRKGLNPYLVARAISRRGTKPRRYLQRAFEDNRQRIINKIDGAVGRIVDK